MFNGASIILPATLWVDIAKLFRNHVERRMTYEEFVSAVHRAGLIRAA